MQMYVGELGTIGTSHRESYTYHYWKQQQLVHGVQTPCTAHEHGGEYTPHEQHATSSLVLAVTTYLLSLLTLLPSEVSDRCVCLLNAGTKVEKRLFSTAKARELMLFALDPKRSEGEEGQV